MISTMKMIRHTMLIVASALTAPAGRSLMVSIPMMTELNTMTNNMIPWNTLPSTIFLKPFIIVFPPFLP